MKKGKLFVILSWFDSAPHKPELLADGNTFTSKKAARAYIKTVAADRVFWTRIYRIK